MSVSTPSAPAPDAPAPGVPMPFARREGGFTTPAAAVAILLVCALLFMSVNGYLVGTRSGQVQYVADAGALAADNVVAEFVTAGQVVDALLLSCSLATLSAYAVSAVASFIPGGGSVAANFASAAAKVRQFRDKFADSAVEGLEKTQAALPALCAARSAAAVQANARASGVDYQGFAVVFPSQGVTAGIDDGSTLNEATSDIESREEDIQQMASDQQQAQETLDNAKEEAWLADCGSDGMNMRERASKLAGLSGSSNPDYASVETWSFTVPLQRAKAYYAARYEAEAGASYDGAPDLVSESVARKRFYKYALAEVSKGSVSISAAGAELPDLKELARNTQQIKETEMYTESIYPVSKDTDGTLTLHGYTGCPCYLEQSAAGTASVSAIDAGTVQRCDTCQFSALTLGRVPSASTSINNGFEYYYRAVVLASREYREAAKEAEELTSELQEQADDIAETLSDAVKELTGARYDPQPPGRYGCVCIVYAPASAVTGLPFLSSSGTASARVAISGATLAADPDDDAGSVVSDAAEGLFPDNLPTSGLLHTVLEAWSSMLKAYTNGTQGVEDAFDTLLGSIPIIGTDLSSAAASSFRSALSSASLEPADLKTYKPVLVNTSHIFERDGGSVATAMQSLKRSADSYGAASAGDLNVLASQLESISGADLGADELVVAELPFSDFGFGLGDAEISIALPSDLSQQLANARSVLEALAGEG